MHLKASERYRYRFAVVAFALALIAVFAAVLYTHNKWLERVVSDKRELLLTGQKIALTNQVRLLEGLLGDEYGRQEDLWIKRRSAEGQFLGKFEGMEFKDGSVLFVLGSLGRELASSDVGLLAEFRLENDDRVTNELLGLAVSEAPLEEKIVNAWSPSGAPYLICVQMLQGRGWTVGVAVPLDLMEEEVQASLERGRREVLLLVSISALALFGAYGLIVRRWRGFSTGREQKLARLNELVDAQREYVLYLDLEGRFTYANPALCALVGIEEKELEGLHVTEVLGEGARQLLSAPAKEAGNNKAATPVEFECELAQGRKLWLSWVTGPAPRGKEVAGSLRVEGRDITASKAVGLEKENRELLLSSAFDNSPFGICIVDSAEMRITMINGAAVEMLGVEDAGRIGTSLEELRKSYETFRPDGSKFLEGELPLERALRDAETVVDEQIVLKRADGQQRWLKVGASTLFDSEGLLNAALLVLDDVTADKLVHRKLEVSLREFNSIARSLRDVLFRIGSDGRILYLSEAIKRFGYEPDELVGESIFKLIPEEDHSKVAKVFDGYVSRHAEGLPVLTRLVADSGEVRGVELLATAEELEALDEFRPSEGVTIIKGSGTYPQGVELVGSIRDITARLQLENRLERSHKLEAIGSLAGGIAHDFNNLLSAIAGYADLAMENLGERERAERNLENVLTATSRATELVGQILAFSRQVKSEPRPVGLKIIAKESLKLLRASLPSTIEIVEELESDATVMGDPSQLHQLVMNLFTNAGHAMRDEGGRLSVSLKMVDVPAKPEAFAVLGDKQCLHLGVADTGPGIPVELRPKIFEPFFTTKDASEGTGLGLSVVSEIVEKLGGYIEVESELGLGTAFHVFLPATAPKEIENEPINAEMVEGDERVLLIDDEPIQVEFMKEALEKHSKRITAFTSSVEALEAFKTSPYDYDVVVTDMTMPKMTGDVLARRLLLVRPELPIVICTGYSERINDKIARAIGVKGLIYKPITGKVLAKKIRDAIREAAPDG